MFAICLLFTIKQIQYSLAIKARVSIIPYNV